MQLLVLGEAGFSGRISLGELTVVALGMLVVAPPIDLLQQLAAAPDRACLDAIRHLAELVVVRLLRVAGPPPVVSETLDTPKGMRYPVTVMAKSRAWDLVECETENDRFHDFAQRNPEAAQQLPGTPVRPRNVKFRPSPPPAWAGEHGDYDPFLRAEQEDRE